MSKSELNNSIVTSDSRRGSLGMGAGLQRLSNNKKGIAATLVVIIAIFGGVYFAMHTIKARSDTQIDQLVSNAVPYLLSQDAPKLQPIASKLVQQSGYQNNANALYVLVIYSISVSDTKNAQTYSDRLQKVYKPAVGYSETLRTSYTPQTPDQLKNEVVGLISATEHAQAGGAGGRGK